MAIDTGRQNRHRHDFEQATAANAGSDHPQARRSSRRVRHVDRSTRRAAATYCSYLIDREFERVVLVERAVGFHVGGQGLSCRSGEALPCRLACDSESVADLLPRCTGGSCGDDLRAANPVEFVLAVRQHAQRRQRLSGKGIGHYDRTHVVRIS